MGSLGRAGTVEQRQEVNDGFYSFAILECRQ